jgi:hypothetical protein
MMIDIAAALIILALVVLVATGLVFAGGHSFGVGFTQIRQTAEILGGVYLLVIWARTLVRHWVVAGQGTKEKAAPTSPVPEVPNAESSPSATN